MEYTVMDFSEACIQAGIAFSDIVRCLAIWGDSSGDFWEGGFSLAMNDGSFAKVLVKAGDFETAADVEIEWSDFEPEIEAEDYESEPTDINKWLDDGADLNDIFDY